MPKIIKTLPEIIEGKAGPAKSFTTPPTLLPILLITSLVVLFTVNPAYARCAAGNCVNGKGAYEYSSGVKYTGEFKLGKRHGQGTISYPEGDKYEGEFKNGEGSGQGTYYYSNGDKYIGEFKDSKRNGHGIYIFADGEKYEAEFLDDERVKNSPEAPPAGRNAPAQASKSASTSADGGDGENDAQSATQVKQVTLALAGGYTYEGQMVGNTYSGHGKLTFPDGSVYEGDFKDNKRHGKGVYTHTNGDKYEGDFVDNKPEGKGTYYFHDNTKYAGDFKDDKFHGTGVLTFTDGARYEGDFKDGKRTGHGTFYFANGFKYTGDFVDGKFEGQGTLTYADGSNKYTGAFHDDKPSGKGNYSSTSEKGYVDGFYISESKKPGTSSGTKASGTGGGGKASSPGGGGDAGGIKPSGTGGGSEAGNGKAPEALAALTPPSGKTAPMSRPSAQATDTQATTPAAWQGGALESASAPQQAGRIESASAPKQAGTRQSAIPPTGRIESATPPTGTRQSKAPAPDGGATDGGPVVKEAGTTLKKIASPEFIDIKVAGASVIDGTGKVQEPKVVVTGRVKDDSGVAVVYVNGAEARVDNDGNFTAELMLKAGNNDITVDAYNIHTKHTLKTVKVTRVTDEEAAPAAQNVDKAATEATPVAVAKPETKPAPDATAAAGVNNEEVPPISGKYYALIIGINNYANKEISHLDTAVNDAKNIADLLKTKYGFEIELLLDEKATRDNIIDAINRYRLELTSDDNLLIYYAGHGYFEEGNKRAYWIPADAHPKIDTKWIMSENVTSQLQLSAAKHVLIVADSCYSGTFTRSAKLSLKPADTRSNYIARLAGMKGRSIISSGGNEPVSDSGGGGHSVFAKAFIDGLLKPRHKAFTAEEIFTNHVKEYVAGNSEQTPEYNSLKNSGDEGGGFIFLQR